MKLFKMTRFSLIAIMVCGSWVGANAAINDPGDVPDLVLHLEANDLGLADGDPVTNWTDSVGGNVFTPQQGFGDSILVADGARGTNDAVFLPGEAGGNLANTSLSVGGTSPTNMTLFVSGRFAAIKTASDGFMVGSQYPTSGSLGRLRIYSDPTPAPPTLSARVGNGGGFDSGVEADLAYHTFAVVSGQSSNEVTLRVDGAVIATDDSGVGATPWVAFSLAGNPRNGGNGADVEIAEVLAYGRALTELEIADVTDYLTQKNIPVANPTNLLFTQTFPLLTSTPIGTEIGQFSSESEVPGTFNYDLVPGAGDTNNASFNVASDKLQTAAAAAGGVLHFRAETRNVGDTNLFLEAAFTVTAETDSDLDGLADDWELTYALNLGVLNGDGVADKDSDGLTDLEEYVLLFSEQAWAVDPDDPDTDGDTLLDGDEVNGTGPRPVTDPTLADTDGDTLSDAVESNTRVFVDASDTGTDPTDKDTDDDTLFDNIELNTGVFVSTNNPGTSPLAPDSDIDGLTDAEELVLDVLFGGPSDPNDWDSDDDTAGDGLEYNVFFSDQNNPASTPAFGWPTPKGTFGVPASYSVGPATPNVAVDELLDGFFVELKVGEQLRLSFDITALQVGNADNLDLRVGFGSTSSCTFPGYMAPMTDLGPAGGTTAELGFRNNSVEWGSNQENTTLASSTQVPANGGITGAGNTNSVSFTLVRNDIGFYAVFQWEEVVLASPITPVQWYSNPLWDRVYVRLQRFDPAADSFEITNLQVTYEDATPPYNRPIVLSDLTAVPGASLSFSFPTDLGSSGYELQATSDLTIPASWSALLSGIPAGGATSTVSTVDVPGGDLSSTQRYYRVIYP